MKKLIALSIALALGGCASTQMQKVVHRPAAHVVPAAAPAVAAPVKPTVTVAPDAPVPPGTFKMRWEDRISRARSHIHFFHQKKTAQ